MPELPEVETVCRGLAHVMQGRRLVRVEVRRKDLRIPFPPGLAKTLTGRRIVRIYRRAKYILMDLDDDHVVIAHLGMSGRMTVIAPGTALEAHDHVVFHTDDGQEVRFNDPRRFGLMTLTTKAALDRHKLFAAQGPDPLLDPFTPEILSAALKGRTTSIKAALLDQRIVVGLGNIYVCEALFRASISPKRKSGTVAGARAAVLVPAIKQVLEEATAVGGSSLRDHVQPSGELGYFQHNWRVYGREGEACTASGHPGGKTAPIKRVVQGGRSTFYCPVCQK
ncbi:MAG: bifunctional DNA-formamidopyrimidine glycosylase/DNA-(apurinic or apyrimidinic site) lyase [Rhodospirillaceae bacterium]|nr:bifunctional DNA-formamidopyrimidine glycosylase/DNA-(apurinic or apyrimidinic site) lyase [Rhodospirillaceae bacterium]